MNLIYSRMSHLIPFKTCVKYKENDDLLIVSTEYSDVLYLNETSKDFYLLCDGKRNIDEITDKMIQIYDISKNEIENDIVSMIRDMQWHSILNLKEL